MHPVQKALRLSGSNGPCIPALKRAMILLGEHMKKISLLSILLLFFTGPCVFAQKNPLKAARNLRNLDRTMFRQITAQNALRKIPKLHVPPSHVAHTVSQVRTRLKENQARIARLRENHAYEDVWEIVTESETPKIYNSQKRLAKDLADFYAYDKVPQFRTASGEVGQVYELPVEGIQYAPLGAKPQILDPQTQVVFYVEGEGAQILNRSVLENSLYFQLVEEE